MSNGALKVKVSIICLSYNHSLYIEKAIEGFLKQKTDFSYEIIIHDDASTDGTLEILRHYELLHPDLIYLISQNDNQYSAFGFSKILQTAIDASSGDYIAICEGDDYWLEDNKLQIQVEGMEKTGAGMSFHPVAELQQESIKQPDIRLYENRVYSLRELLRKDFHYVQTSSIVLSRISLKNLSYDIMSRSPVADVVIKIAASIDNGAICVPLVGSVYRVLSEGSWTSSMQHTEKFLVYIRKMLLTIDELNIFYQHELTSDFERYKYKFVRAVVNNPSVPLSCKFNFTGSLSRKYKILSYMTMSVRALRIHFILKTIVRFFLNLLRVNSVN